MLILSKKRIAVMLCLVFISLYAFSFKISNDSNNINQTIQTVSLPVSGRTVIVDAGHPEYFLTR